MFVLLLTLALFLAIGVPVAFAVGLSTLLAMAQHMSLDPTLVTVAQRIATSLDSFTLLAIPFFILAGSLMNHGGSARRLVDFAAALLSPLPSALAHVHITASMLFGAISGSAVATASAIGSLMGPRMVSRGYDRDFTAAINITASTTGLVIPPSNVLIVYSLASGGTSIAALFVAGYLPGILMGLALMVVAAAFSSNRRGGIIIVASQNKTAALLAAALPSLGLPVVVMGGIVSGVFTPTEASAVAVVYALGLALAYGEMPRNQLPKVFADAAITAGVVMFLIATSVALSWLLAYEQVPQRVAGALLATVGHPVAILLVINFILLVVGTFIDMTPAVLIFTPIFLPVVTSFGMDPIHFGIMMVMNLCIGLCTPPLGSVLFVGIGVANTKLKSVLPHLLPLFVATIATLLIVTFVPAVSLWLPRLFGY